MKVEVWATQYRPEYKSTCIWSGKMSCVPRKDDVVFVFDGWGGLPVRHVYWNLKEQTVELGVDDHKGEYRREFEKLNKDKKG